jgi:hypothetical protein
MDGYENDVEPVPDKEFPLSEGNGYESGKENLLQDAFAAAAAACAAIAAPVAEAAPAAVVDG